jgi:hypothetical protein
MGLSLIPMHAEATALLSAVGFNMGDAEQPVRRSTQRKARRR